MKAPPWLQKNWPFLAAAVFFVFFAFQLSRAAGCASEPEAPAGQNWPKQKMPEHMKKK